MKKKKNKREKSMTLEIRTPQIGVETKKDVLVKLPAQSLSEDEMRIILEKLTKENIEMKLKYYSKNSPIAETRQRKFLELVRKFCNRKIENSVLLTNMKKTNI